MPDGSLCGAHWHGAAREQGSVSDCLHSVILNGCRTMCMVAVDVFGMHPGVLHRAAARANQTCAGWLGGELIKTIRAAPKAFDDRDGLAPCAFGMLERFQNQDDSSFAQRESGAAGVEWRRRSRRERLERVEAAIDERMECLSPTDDRLITETILDQSNR